MIRNSILETIGNTPVVRIRHLAPKGVELFVKCEAFNPMGSVKDRLALGVIEAAERDGTLKPGQTLVEATSGNTGIGLAMVCAAKGYPLVVTMAESFSVERRRLMRFLGAQVVLTPASEKGTGMVRKARELAEAHGWFLARQFENPANADIHARTTAEEILSDFGEDGLDYWVTGFGTGGTLNGVARVLKARGPRTRIVAAEPDNSAILASGHVQAMNPDGSAAESHPGFRPHPMQGWSPDFISKLAADVLADGHDRRLPAGSRRRGDATRPRSRPARRHLLRHLGWRHLRRRARGGEDSANGKPHPGDAAGHRRTLHVDAAIRRHPCRDDRGGDGAVLLDPVCPVRRSAGSRFGPDGSSAGRKARSAWRWSKASCRKSPSSCSRWNGASSAGLSASSSPRRASNTRTSPSTRSHTRRTISAASFAPRFIEISGTPTIPQIFVGGLHIGGATETFDAYNDGHFSSGSSPRRRVQAGTRGRRLQLSAEVAPPPVDHRSSPAEKADLPAGAPGGLSR